MSDNNNLEYMWIDVSGSDMTKDELDYLERKYNFFDSLEIVDAPCCNCPNHSSNGGSGVCYCILGGNVSF